MRLGLKNLQLGSAEAEYTKEDVAAAEPELSEEKNPFSNINELAMKTSEDKERKHRAFDFRLIPREKIVFNENNEFPITENETEELSESILNRGLFYNLEGYYDEDTDRYVLEAGEKRTRALDLLFTKYDGKPEEPGYDLYELNVKPLFDEGIPFNVKRLKYNAEGEADDIDKIDSTLRLFEANLKVRNFTPQQLAVYAKKMKELLEERNKLINGKDAAPVKNKEIATALGTSVRQYQKYAAVDRLIPALRQEFDNGNISINKIPGIAALPEEEQEIFLSLLQEGKKPDPEEIKYLSERAERAENERMGLIEEKEQLEAELSSLKAAKDSEIQKIIEESREKESNIRAEIEKAVNDKNEELIAKLQDDLAQERENSGKMIRNANNQVTEAKRSLAELQEKLAEYENSTQDAEEIKFLAELEAKFSLLQTVALEFTNKLKAALEEGRDISQLTTKIKEDSVLRRLTDILKEY